MSMNFRFLNNMSMGRRLATGFAIILSMMIGVAAINALQMRSVGEQMRQIVEVNNHKATLASSLLNHINQMALQARTITLLTDVREMQTEAKALADAEANYGRVEAELGRSIAASGGTDAELKLLKELIAAGQLTMPLIKLAARQGQSGANIEATETLASRVRPNESLWQRRVAELIDLEQLASRTAHANARSQQRAAQAVVGVLVALAVAIGALIGWLITCSVKYPVNRAILVAERIADGDLTSEVDADAQDEIGRLLAAIKAMQERLRHLVGEIGRSAQSIRCASSEVAGGNADLSARTEQAAGSLEATASSMEQLTATVRQTAESATTANKLALSASTVAERGGQVVSEVVATMDRINASSQRIADIIGVINAIAFQTNILALNAAVEAARAGEQGRGFAVVAGEVRSLAHRSAESAKEIKALIGTSVDDVQAGARLVRAAGTTMDEIVSSVQSVTAIIGEITAAASEQSEGIGHINATVNKLDGMTQQNAALVEQSAAAAESLRDQADKLARMVAAFQLERSVG